MSTRKVIILSGVSGSGKTHLADKLRKEAGHEAAVVSADFYFEHASGYKFDASKLGEAHAQCLRLFINFLQEGRPLVVVSNTNLSAWEIAPYYQTAVALGYEPEIITIQCDAAVAAARNLHGLDGGSVSKQYRKLANRQLPPQWKNTFVPAGV